MYGTVANHLFVTSTVVSSHPILDLDLDRYSTNPQKGQHAEGGGAHALGGERSQPALEG